MSSEVTAHNHRGATAILFAVAAAGCIAIASTTAFLPTTLAHPARPSFPRSRAHVTQDTATKLYAINCAPCHQLSGLGLGDTIPPLAGSEWVTGSETRLLRVMLGGLTGEVEVQGEMFKGAMPGWGPILDDGQIAAVATYIRKSWGNKAPPVGVAIVAQIRRASADRKTPWTAEELRKFGGTPIGGARVWSRRL